LEISRCDKNGVVTPWGEHVPPEKVTASYLPPMERHRLGSLRPGADGHWFRFDSASNFGDVAREAVQYLEDADNWWKHANKER
jgi:hypothetical protein